MSSEKAWYSSAESGIREGCPYISQATFHVSSEEPGIGEPGTRKGCPYISRVM
jgi:hypothetical protein